MLVVGAQRIDQVQALGQSLGLALGAGAGDEGKGVLAELRIGLARVDLERLRLDAGLGGIDGLAVLLGHADDAQLSAPVGRQLNAKVLTGRVGERLAVDLAGGELPARGGGLLDALHRVGRMGGQQGGRLVVGRWGHVRLLVCDGRLLLGQRRQGHQLVGRVVVQLVQAANLVGFTVLVVERKDALAVAPPGFGVDARHDLFAVLLELLREVELFGHVGELLRQALALQVGVVGVGVARVDAEHRRQPVMRDRVELLGIGAGDAAHGFEATAAQGVFQGVALECLVVAERHVRVVQDFGNVHGQGLGHGFVLGLALLLVLLLNLLLLEGQHVVVNLLGIGGRAEHLQRLVLQRLDPRTHIGGVLARIVADAQLVADDHGSDLGAQLFLGVPLAPERVRQVAVKARSVARPVAQLVQRGRVVAVGAGELAALRQGDAVGRRAVERPITGGVGDRRARGFQDVLGALDGVPSLFLLRLERRQAVDLLAVEHGRKEHARPLQHDGFLDRLALRIEDGPAAVVQLVLLFAELPVLNRRAFLALANLRAHGGGLLVGHPARIAAALGHQVDGVDPFVPLAGGRVHRQVGVGFARLPRLLPRCGAGLELLDQLFGHDFVKRLLRLHVLVPSE